MRFILKVLICGLLAVAAGTAYLAMRSGDTAYTLHEWLSPGRFQQHDELIRTVAAQNGVDPMLVKAVVWRESRFDPQKYGSAGERGLMQVTERAASEWVKETHVENFRVEELFDPQGESSGRNVVPGAGDGALEDAGRSGAIRARGIQCRGQSRAALGGG